MIFKLDKNILLRKIYKKNSDFKQNIFLGIFVFGFFCLVFQQIWLANKDVLSANTQSNIITSIKILGQDNVVVGSGLMKKIDIQKKDIDKLEIGSKVDVQILGEKYKYGIAAGGGLIYLGQKDLDIYFSSLKLLDIKWVRWDIEWSEIQKNDSASYDWEGTDRVVKTARRYGINSLGIITYAPKWASVKGCKSNSKCVPADPKVFAHFAGEVVARYKDSIWYWEIWNEPNLSSFWNSSPNVEKYAEILEASYKEIKKRSPLSIVLSGGLTSAVDEKNGNILPTTFMKKLYSLGANKYLDAVALHPYSYPNFIKNEAYQNSWQQISNIRKLMVENGDDEKKIWITEYGAPTGGPGKKHDINKFKFKSGSDYISENKQKEMIQNVLNIHKESEDWMGPFFLYSLKDISNKMDDPESYFGLLRYDGSKKPAYDIYREAILNIKK